MWLYIDCAPYKLVRKACYLPMSVLQCPGLIDITTCPFFSFFLNIVSKVLQDKASPCIKHHFRSTISRFIIIADIALFASFNVSKNLFLNLFEGNGLVTILFNNLFSMKIQCSKFWWNIDNPSMRLQQWQQSVSKINSPNKIRSQSLDSNLQRRHLSPIITSKSTIINQAIKLYFLMNELIGKFLNTYILFDIILYFCTKSSSIIVNLLAGYCWWSLSSSYFDWALTVPITWHCCLFFRIRWSRS